MRSIAWLASAAVALTVGACGDAGGGERKPDATPQVQQRSEPIPAPPASEPESAAKLDRADVRVVRAWADTLRRGDVRSAASYFALPSRVANGTPPIRLRTRAHARIFNRTLPCGAKLIRAEPASRGFFIATFRLTERPGEGRCGTGTGETARTAFRVRGERITDWLRVQDIPSGPETLS